MRTKHIYVLSGIGLCVLAAIYWIGRREPQPSYNGKTVFELSEIVADRGFGQWSGWTNPPVADAVTGLRILGPRAERTLIIQMQTRSTGWRGSKGYETLWLRAPPFVRRALPRYVHAVYLRQIAVVAMGKVGPLSPEGEHALVLACQDPDAIVRTRAGCVLGYRGSRSPETLRALQQAIRDSTVPGLIPIEVQQLGLDPKLRTIEELAADLSRPLVEARYQTASALRDLGPRAQPAVPALIAACDDPESMVRICSIKALGRIGAGASNAIPRLRANAKEGGSFMEQQAAAEAVQQIEAR
jgi:HEAT repeat protein